MSLPFPIRPVSRRAALRLAGLAGAGALLHPLVPPPALAGPPPRPPLPSDTTPGQALEALYDGNERFVSGRGLHPRRSLERVRELATGQTPFAAVLGCADSRVPVELIFDQGFGDLFVTRVAGNVVTPEILGSLEFAGRVLGAKVIYVLGHSGCGAVAAAAKGEEVPGQISALFAHLRPAVRSAGGDVHRAILENVRTQAELLAESSPVLSALVRSGALVVSGGVYDVNTGRVTPLRA